MSLNRERGEVLAGMGPYRVVPAAKWRELPRVHHVYQEYEIPDNPCTRLEIKSRPLYADALARAQAAFQEAGAMMPVVIPESAILVQEYPKTSQVVFLFAREVAGRELIVALPPYTLDHKVIGWLTTTGRWVPDVVH